MCIILDLNLGLYSHKIQMNMDPAEKESRLKREIQQLNQELQ